MKKNFVYIILASIAWGTSGLFVNALGPMGLSSLQMATIRGSVAAICMSLYALIFDRSLFKISLSEFALFLCSGVSMYLTCASYYSSIQASSVSMAVVLMYTAPIMIMAYSVAFFGERFTVKKCCSLICMVIGCAFVSGIVGGIEFNLWGVLFGLGAGVAYSSYNIFTKIQMRRKSNPVSASMYCFIFMALVSLVPSNPVHILKVAYDNMPNGILLMVGCGVITSVLPYFLYTLSLKKIPVGVASALSIIEPMAAMILSIAFLGEKLNVFSLCGIILILGSVFVLSTEKSA